MATPDRNGNFISEWYGHRIYPQVRIDVGRASGVRAGQCPFLSKVTLLRTACVKNASSAGVCTISSASNGPRQDWLVCPYRVIGSDIVRRGCERIFGRMMDAEPMPVSVLGNEAIRATFANAVRRDGTGYLFFQDKLGGEISVPGTSRSPEVSFDVTLVEIRPDARDGFDLARYGILEIQTMDYHGSYRAAVSNLRDGLRLHDASFPSVLQDNLSRWAGEGIEGPNVANVFKRTFYQMMLKFRLAGEGDAAAGTVLALPKSVWQSWQPFLGAPDLEPESSDVMRLRLDGGPAPEMPLNAYICVFDLDGMNAGSVSPVRIEHFIRVCPERLAAHAFTVVPSNMLQSIQEEGSMLARIRSRLARWWPQFPSAAGGPSR